jgi:hypothetical protein
MQANPLKEGTLTENSVGIGRVTRGMVRSRATELAVSNGRSPHEVSKSDWEQAKLSLTGTAADDPTEAAIEAAPESDRWNPVPGFTGNKTLVAPGEDEDDEGRSDRERLVRDGVAEAELDLEFKASQAAAVVDL